MKLLSKTNSTRHPENSVAEELRVRIRTGIYRSGDWLPTERTLAEDLEVDRRIVRLAINQLVEAGVVTREPRCRPVVASGSAEVKNAEAKKIEPREARPAPATTTFIALLMWHGGGQFERTMSAQQRIYWGLNQALAKAGHHAVFVDVGEVRSEENAVREAEKLRYILAQGFGGIVFYPYAYDSNAALIEELQQQIPIVAIDRRTAFADTNFVGVDNRQAMAEMIRHLIAQGHRRIAYLTQNEMIAAVQDRIQGYMDAVREASLDEMILSIPSHSYEQAWTAVDAVFQLPAGQRPTAAAAYNDYSAIQFAERLQTFGLSVPEDVAVTGFDDIVPTLPNGVGLTSMAQPFEQIGSQAAELILRSLKTPIAAPLSVSLPALLTVRESSALVGPP